MKVLISIKQKLSDFDFASTQVEFNKAASVEIFEWTKQYIPDEAIYEEHPYVKDSNGREENPHVTVKWGLEVEEPGFAENILKGYGLARIVLGKVSHFDNSDEYDVVKVDVESKDLAKMNAALTKHLPNTETFPEYKPHVTLAYVKKGLGSEYSGSDHFEGRKVLFDRVMFINRKKEKMPILLKGTHHE